MKYIGKLLGWMLLCINAIVAGLMLLSAYSPYLNPSSFPILSCAGLAFPVFLAANLLFLFFWLLIYRKFALLPILAFVCCWGSIRTYTPLNLFAEEKPDGAIKFLSYNTMAFAERQPHKKESSNEVLDYLLNSKADIICLQEYIWGGKLKQQDITYALRSYKYRYYHSFANGLNGLGIFSRYPILSATPIKMGSRTNGAIVYQVKVNEDTLLIINNHLESNKIAEVDKEVYSNMLDDPNKQNLTSGGKQLLKKLAEASVVRASQADALASIINESAGKKIIVCGDFNDSPISYSHRVLTQNLNDAFVESGNGLGISYNRNRFYFRIDHILLSPNLKAYDCVVDRSIKASDHYPVWCYISLNEE